MRQRTPILCFAVLIAWWAGGGARADTEPVRCALLVDSTSDTAASALADLVHVQLADSTTLQLLDRAEIDRVLAEHHLSQALADMDRQGRQAWGQALRAQLLVRVMARAGPQARTIQVEIAETSMGLVLARDAWVWGDDPAAIARLIAHRVETAAGVVRGGIRWIVAVPPFASGDLTYTQGHYKQAFARLIEEVVRQVPGVAVVDFVHADEIARELAFSQGGAVVQRDLPLYVHGWYGTAGDGDDLEFSVRVEIKRGAEGVATIAREGLARIEVASFIGEIERAVRLALEAAPEAPAGDASAASALEARMLAERVAAVRLVGDWLEVAQLGEACLLLDPFALRVHRMVAEACGYLGRDHCSGNADREARNPRMEFSRAHSRLARRQFGITGVQHWRTYFSGREPTADDTWAYGTFVGDMGIFLNRGDALDPECVRVHRDLLRQERELYRLILSRVPLAVSREVVWYAYLYADRTIEPPHAIPLDEFYGIVAEMVLLFDRFPTAVYHQFLLLEKYMPGTPEMSSMDGRDSEVMPALRRCLAHLQQASTGGAALAATIIERSAFGAADADKLGIVADVEQLIAHNSMRSTDREHVMRTVRRLLGLQPPQPGKDSLLKVFEVDDIRFTPFRFSHPGGFEGVVSPDEIVDIFACGEYGHAAMTLGGAYLVNHAGVAQPVALDKCEGSLRVWDATFDGRYLWMLLRGEKCHLRAVDVTTGTCVATLGGDDGLPPATLGGKIAGVAPGEVIAAGAFGRTWIARVQLGQEPADRSARKVQVLLEARHVPLESTWSSPGQTPPTPLPLDTAFEPQRIMIVPASGQDGPWAIVSRRIERLMWELTPVVVNLRDSSLTLAEAPWSAPQSALLVDKNVTVDSPCAHFKQSEAPAFVVPIVHGIERFEVTGLAPAYEVHPVYDGQDTRLIHLVCQYWCTIDPAKRELSRMVKLPYGLGNGDLYDSPQFGLIYYQNASNAFMRRGMWRIEFLESPAE